MSNQTKKYFPALNDVMTAEHTLGEILSPTPLMGNRNLSDRYEANVMLKREDLQVVRSYKIRGAYNMIRSLTPDQTAKGIVCASAGNHAQGVALSCNKLGITGKRFMPVTTPKQKINQVRMFGGNAIEVVLAGDTFDESNRAAMQACENEGKTFIPPFNHPKIIEGQGTVGLEILQQSRAAVDYIFVPIGGGGLISGVAFAIKSLKPNVKVYGVQASGAPSMLNSITHQQIERLNSVSTIADGIAVKEPGIHTYDICNKYVDGIVTVTDDEISTAILTLIEQQKLIAEGAGAVSVAAAMFNKVPVKGKKVICLVSGGNIDVTILSRVINRGHLKTGRSYTLTVELPDRPGQLVGVTEILAKMGANVISVHHERAGSKDITGCYLQVVMETRNHEHIEKIRQALIRKGYHVIS